MPAKSHPDLCGVPESLHEEISAIAAVLPPVPGCQLTPLHTEKHNKGHHLFKK